MQGRCDKHLFEAAEGRCRHCGFEFCSDCLVYSFGPANPPFCIPCAVAAAGIRSTAGNRPLLSRRDLKRLHKAERRAAREVVQSTDGPSDGPTDGPPPGVTPPSQPIPVPLEWAAGLEGQSATFAG